MELKEYILKNECLEIHVCNLGGIIKNIFVRDCRWKLVDVVLGFDTLEQYIDPEYRIITLISGRSSDAMVIASKAGKSRLTTRLTC